MSASHPGESDRRSRRITKKEVPSEPSYKELHREMVKSVADIGYCELAEVRRGAGVRALPVHGVNGIAWQVLREIAEDDLNTKLVPVSKYFFDKQTKRLRRTADRHSEFARQDIRRCLACGRTPSGFISATSPNPFDQAVVREALISQYKSASGMKQSADVTTQRLVDANLIAADKAAQLAQRFSGNRLR